jgi:ABC-type nitrate/sulfonate/bicarbonate transport system substrate-binding protein
VRSNHKTLRRRLFPPAIAATAALIVGACSSASSTASSGVGTTSRSAITIALPVDAPSQAPVYLASTLGYFRQEGIDAHIVVLTSDTTADAAMVSGSVQYTSVNAVAMITAAEKGVPVEDICTEYDGPEYALALNPATLTSSHASSGMSVAALFHALRGVSVGIVGTAASAPGLILTGLLKEEGLPANWLHLVDITQSGLAPAYAHGEVGAVFDDEPVPDQVTWEGILGTRSYVSGNARVDRAVCAAIAKADNYLLKDPVTASNDLSGSFGPITPALITQTIRSRKWAPGAGMTAAGWANGAKVLAGLGLINQPSPALLNGAVSTAYLPASATP